MMHLPLLWADGEWVKLLIPLVMFVVWVLNKVMGANSPAGRAANKGRVAGRGNPPPPPEKKQRIEDEVGEFLRRAAQQRGENDNRKNEPAPPRPPKQARKHLSELPGGRRATREGAAEAEAQANQEAAREEESRRPRKRVEPAVAPKEVEQAVAAMQSHVHQVFDHKVGRLTDVAAITTSQAAETEMSPAAEVTAMLRDPQTIREAIIVSEILRRPEERW